MRTLDPLGLGAESDGVLNSLNSALRLNGLFVTTAVTVMKAIDMLRRDTHPMVYDAVIAVISSMRFLEGALNLLHEMRVLSGDSGKSVGKPSLRRPFAVLLASDG
jgi:hypothetical protein